MLVPLAKIACYAWGGYSTYKALSANATLGKRQRWACYWITLVVLEAVEPIADWLLFWVPFYYNAKLVLLLCLCFWTTKATTPIFKSFIHPVMSRKQQKLTYYEKSLHTSLASAQTSVAVRVNRISTWLPQIKWSLPPIEPDMIEDETEEADIAEEPSKQPDITETTSSLDIASILEIASSDPQQITLGTPEYSYEVESEGQTTALLPKDAAMQDAEAAEQERLAEELLDIDLMAELLSISELDYSIPEDGGSDIENHATNKDRDMPILSIDDILNMPDPQSSSGLDEPALPVMADVETELRTVQSSEALENFDRGSENDDVHALSKSPAESPAHVRRTRRHGAPTDDAEYAEPPYSGTRITALPPVGPEPDDDRDSMVAIPRFRVSVARGSAPGSAGGSAAGTPAAGTPSPPLRKITRPTSVAGRSRTVVSSLGREQAAALRRSARLKAAGNDRGEPSIDK
ncbi:Receptor expression-enhancing protein 2 [Geranomyces variabilis]|uniref:Receptor expression-enhancing protein 2 n=1 Tax=Geranomyces variabilis TaxID=109894 RepID=A0AAD5TF77_9FUNG|nr:Receptor expression-enhancing protein 2 [Geranomyces variabilis]